MLFRSTALVQAESSSWEAVILHDTAENLDISLKDVRRVYPQKDGLVEAWFDRADQAVLSENLQIILSNCPPVTTFIKSSCKSFLHGSVSSKCN